MMMRLLLTASLINPGVIPFLTIKSYAGARSWAASENMGYEENSWIRLAAQSQSQSQGPAPVRERQLSDEEKRKLETMQTGEEILNDTNSSKKKLSKGTERKTASPGALPGNERRSPPTTDLTERQSQSTPETPVAVSGTAESTSRSSFLLALVALLLIGVIALLLVGYRIYVLIRRNRAM